MVNLVADVASYQPDTLAFFQAMKNAGVKAVIVKITQGSNPGDAYVNPKARNQIKYARQVGLLVHAYHYAKFHGVADAKAEAAWFVKNARDHGIGPESVMALDVEDKVNKWEVTEDSNAFLQYVRDAGYPNVDLYTGASWIWAKRVDRNRLIAKNLWIASYGVSQPGVDNVGTWQFRSDYPVGGEGIDMSYDFSGFYTNAKVTANSQSVINTPAPQPIAVPDKWVDTLGATWIKENGTFTSNTAINLRWGATLQSSKLAELPAGSEVKYDAYSISNGFVWIRQPRGNGQYAYLATGRAYDGKRLDRWGSFK